MTMVDAPPAVPEFTMPRLGQLLRHAAPRVLDSMILPVAVFYVGFMAGGLVWGIGCAVAWVYGGVGWRLLTKREVPGALFLAAMSVAVRAVLGLASGSAVIFFLQPTLGVLCVSVAFLGSATLRRPLAQRVTTDLVPLPDHVVKNPVMGRFFRRQSVMWGGVQFCNFAFSLWMLFSQPLQTYLVVRTAAVAVLLTGAGLAALIDFRRSLRALQPGA
ncbi:VC0807 family protein [Nonomuraea sp. NPDC050556]|uniref:VC0807 family protein n=1 Tax=Nonomuraea sp. NPDC050556 TaxID=3364369 RepID=UPI00379367E2